MTLLTSANAQGDARLANNRAGSAIIAPSKASYGTGSARKIMNRRAAKILALLSVLAICGANLARSAQPAADDRPVSFRLDVMPIFMAYGCNTGSCHGSARGQDGFRLSLFGFDPEGDYQGFEGPIETGGVGHAPDPDEAFAIICGGCGVPDAHAARLSLVVYLRSLGEWEHPTRRVVSTVHEIRGVKDGKPDAKLLFRWNEKTDRFERGP